MQDNLINLWNAEDNNQSRDPICDVENTFPWSSDLRSSEVNDNNRWHGIYTVNSLLSLIQKCLRDAALLRKWNKQEMKWTTVSKQYWGELLLVSGRCRWLRILTDEMPCGAPITRHTTGHAPRGTQPGTPCGTQLDTPRGTQLGTPCGTLQGKHHAAPNWDAPRGTRVQCTPLHSAHSYTMVHPRILYISLGFVCAPLHTVALWCSNETQGYVQYGDMHHAIPMGTPSQSSHVTRYAWDRVGMCYTLRAIGRGPEHLHRAQSTQSTHSTHTHTCVYPYLETWWLHWLLFNKGIGPRSVSETIQ